MKYTIFGFSQEEVLKLRDEHQAIDERDLMILRWIMDFYFGGIEKRVIDGAEYGWVNASYVCGELPIMNLNPEALRRRLKKLVRFGLISHKQVKNSEVGTRAYYRPTELAAQLQSDGGDTSECYPVSLQSYTRATSKCDGGATSKCYPVSLQSPNKDSSINDSSSRDSESKYIVRKQASAQRPAPSRPWNEEEVAKVAEVVKALNEETGSHYRPTSKATMRHILARLREGFTVEECKEVIRKKSEEWGGTDMAKYLRPETLFGSKFEGYLNAPEDPKAKEMAEKAKADAEWRKSIDERCADWDEDVPF